MTGCCDIRCPMREQCLRFINRQKLGEHRDTFRAAPERKPRSCQHFKPSEKNIVIGKFR